MISKNKLIVLVAASLILLGGIFIIGTRLFEQQTTEKLETVRASSPEAFVRQDAARLGSPEAPIYLVEFIDPECESCRAFYPFVKSLLREFEGRVQLVMRYAPFHPNSIFAVKIIEAARKQGKYWETLEVLLKHQPEWGSHHHPRPELIWTYLSEVDLDVEQLRKDMNDPDIMRMIEEDIQDGQRIGVRATPSFFVNGKALTHFGKSELRQLILDEINRP